MYLCVHIHTYLSQYSLRVVTCNARSICVNVACTYHMTLQGSFQSQHSACSQREASVNMFRARRCMLLWIVHHIKRKSGSMYYKIVHM